MGFSALRSGVVGVVCAAQMMRRGRQLMIGVVLAGLLFATSQAQAVLVTIRIVDQNNVEIPVSEIRIQSLALIALTGDVVELPEAGGRLPWADDSRQDRSCDSAQVVRD